MRHAFFRRTNRSGNGTLSTHWRIGSWGKISSTNRAALPASAPALLYLLQSSAIRRAPQLGQKQDSILRQVDKEAFAPGDGVHNQAQLRPDWLPCQPITAT